MSLGAVGLWWDAIQQLAEHAAQPRVILLAHLLLCFWAMQAALVWPSVLAKLEEDGNVKVSQGFVCVGAALWHHQMRSGISLRLLLWSRAVSSYLGSLLGAHVGGGAWLVTHLVSTFAGGSSRLNGSFTLVPNNTAASALLLPRPTGRPYCFGLTIWARMTHRDSWFSPFSLWSAELGPPAESCVNACSQYLDPMAWPGVASNGTEALLGALDTVRHPFLENGFYILSLLDASISLSTALWTFLMVIWVEVKRSFGNEGDYDSMGSKVRGGLRRIFLIQFVLAACRAFYISRLLRHPFAASELSILGRVGLLAACMLMQVGASGIALVALSLISLLTSLLVCMGGWLALGTKITIGKLWRFLRLVATEPQVDGHSELSLSTSKSFGAGVHGTEGDDICAICLSPLHPEVAITQGLFAADHNSGRLGFATSVAKLSPQIRLAVSRRLSRVHLVRLARCKHAFHAECYEGVRHNMPRPSRFSCPTCRAPSETCAWRTRPLSLAQVADFVRDELDLEIAGMAFVLLSMLFLLGFAVGLFGRLGDPFNAASIRLHQAHGVPWPVLNAPMWGFFLFRVLSSQSQLSLGSSAVVAALCSYPLALAWSFAPVVTLLLSVACVLRCYGQQ